MMCSLKWARYLNVKSRNFAICSCTSVAPHMLLHMLFFIFLLICLQMTKPKPMQFSGHTLDLVMPLNLRLAPTWHHINQYTCRAFHFPWYFGITLLSRVMNTTWYRNSPSSPVLCLVGNYRIGLPPKNGIKAWMMSQQLSLGSLRHGLTVSCHGLWEISHGLLILVAYQVPAERLVLTPLYLSFFST